MLAPGAWVDRPRVRVDPMDLGLAGFRHGTLHGLYALQSYRLIGAVSFSAERLVCRFHGVPTSLSPTQCLVPGRVAVSKIQGPEAARRHPSRLQQHAHGRAREVVPGRGMGGLGHDPDSKPGLRAVA